jgi:hypothetical protein
MNKRIRELAHQAGDDLNKFAELIIQDCIECCVLVAQAAIDERQRVSLPAYLHGREDAASLCKSTIQKHFGEGK